MRFYGFLENKREEEMDMREMVDKVKKGESLYGKSELTPYMQGVASRNSRYSGVFLYALPWYNFVNHNQVRLRPVLNCCDIEWNGANRVQHGVDTAKYYLQAERELAAENK